MRPFASHGSWALWGPLDRDPAEPFTRASDIGFPEAGDAELEPLLTRRAVFVGLNPGNGFEPDRGPWANWHHGPRSNDHLIAEALRATPLWGSYMTDLVQTIESDSAVIAAALAADAVVVLDGVLRLGVGLPQRRTSPVPRPAAPDLGPDRSALRRRSPRLRSYA